MTCVLHMRIKEIRLLFVSLIVIIHRFETKSQIFEGRADKNACYGTQEDKDGHLDGTVKPVP